VEVEFYTSPVAFAVAVFAGMLLMLEIGRRLSLRRLARGETDSKAGLSTLKGAIFGLTSLILAFSFSGAMSRYDARRALILAEANAIGTAYLRVDLLSADDQPHLRELFRQYVDARIAIFRALPDLDAAMVQLARSKELQSEIWAAATTSIRRTGSSPSGALLVAALNEMIDLTTTRMVAALSHPPEVIFGMIFILMLASALVAGQDMATAAARHFMHHVAYAVVLSMTVYVILEIEFPRMGLIRIDRFDQLLVDARADMR
jgi:hypothetical protein